MLRRPLPVHEHLFSPAVNRSDVVKYSFSHGRPAAAAVETVVESEFRRLRRPHGATSRRDRAAADALRCLGDGDRPLVGGTSRPGEPAAAAVADLSRYRGGRRGAGGR